jgi:hypothetical protein
LRNTHHSRNFSLRKATRSFRFGIIIVSVDSAVEDVCILLATLLRARRCWVFCSTCYNLWPRYAPKASDTLESCGKTPYERNPLRALPTGDISERTAALYCGNVKFGEDAFRVILQPLGQFRKIIT